MRVVTRRFEFHQTNGIKPIAGLAHNLGVIISRPFLGQSTLRPPCACVRVGLSPYLSHSLPLMPTHHVVYLTPYTAVVPPASMIPRSILFDYTAVLIEFPGDKFIIHTGNGGGGGNGDSPHTLIHPLPPHARPTDRCGLVVDSQIYGTDKYIYIYIYVGMYMSIVKTTTPSSEE